MAGKKTGKRLLTWVLVLVMALSLLPLNALAVSNSTVKLHPSVGSTVTGVKVKVGDIISGHRVSSISGYDITVDLGKYNVNNDTFRLPYAKDIWKGVDNNKVDYISWAGSGSNRRSEGASALLANGKNTAYYYFKGAPVLLTFTLNYAANGGTGAPASQTYKATSEYEKSHTFTIASQVPTRDGYTFLGWNTNRSATTANYQPDGSIVVTGTTTLYAVWEENTPPKPDKPTAPDEGDLSGLIGDITVNCTNTEATHSDKIKTYALIEDSYTTSEVAGDAENGYTCTVTINSQKYVEQFDSDTGATHTPKDATATVTLEYKNSAWLVKSGTPISFNVVCDAAPADPKLGENFDFSANKMVVDVICETTSDHNGSYGLMNDYYTVDKKTKLSSDRWQCEITINLDKYFALYNSEHTGHTRDMEHKEATAIMRIYPTWYASSGKWIFVESGVTAAKIYVKCDATPTEPSKDDIKELLGSNAVQIICTNGESNHGSKTFGLIDGTFSIVHSGYNCEVKIDSFNEYVYSFNTELGVAQGTHASDNSKTGQQIINLKWMNGKWTVVDAPAEHYVLCVTPKYTVTYTDGVDTEEVFKDQVYTNLRKGADTPAFDGGTPTRKGYNFTNWLPAVAETVTDNATYTAQWEKDDSQWFTVKYDANGGTGTVTDSKEYLSDDTVTVKGGNSLKKDGYDFTGWNTKKDGTGDTYAENDEFNITGNTTLYAQWKAKEYSFTVNYLWDNTPIPNIPSTTGSDALGTEVIPNTDIDGYTLISGQPTSMTIGAGENVLNLNYYKNVTLTANSDSATYDGTEHTVTGYTAKDNENKAVEGLTFTGVASPSASGTDAGEYDVEFSGSAVGAHNNLYYVTAANPGKLTINKRSVTLTSETASKVYDGTPLTRPNVKVTGDGFVEGEGATYNVTGTITNVGTTDNTFTYTLKDGTKATNYTITKKEGKLTITEASAPTPATFDFNDVVYGDGKDTPAITKTVKGNVGKNFTEAFYVTVKGADEKSTATMSAPASYTGKAEVTYSDLKDIAFQFTANNKLTFRDRGTYTYTVREVPGKTSRMSYDTTEYTLTIKVVLNKNTNKYEVESWQFPVGNREYPTLLNIVNTYRTYHPSTPSKPTLNTGDHYAYVMGYPDGMVRPNGSITRAEVSAILFRLLSDKTRDEYFTTESSFTDVKAGAWYNNSIATLEKAGVIVDTAKGGAFRPNEAITRAELAAMLAQFSDAKPVKGVKFSDVSAEHWAYEAIAIAAKMGWIEGYPDGTFRPDATITRAEMMTLVNRALERVPSDEDHLLSKRVMLTFPDCKSGDWFYIAVQEATNSHTYERAATEKNGDEQWTALRANRDWTLLEK